MRFLFCLAFLSFSASALSGQDEIPPEAEQWKRDRGLLQQGLEKAHQLRRRLLADGSAGALRIADAIVAFQAGSAAALQEETPTAFHVSRERLVAQLSGGQRIPRSCFDGFDGRWFGRWDALAVNHDWHPSEQFRPAKPLAGKHAVSSLQFAWIGNGFGWNYLAEVGDGRCVLGMVHYVDSAQPTRIVGEMSHVGFADAPTRLVWITATNVFLEEVFQAGTAQEHYLITGFRHRLLDGEAEVSDEGFQAKYTRDPDNRPAFKTFRWK